MEFLKTLNIEAILQIGLPGLVFLLTTFSFVLLMNEQKKEEPNHYILNTIRYFLKVNIALTVFTGIMPFIQNYFCEAKYQEYQSVNLQAKIATTDLEDGYAIVCDEADYRGKYVLIRDLTKNAMIQRKCLPMPCADNQQGFIFIDRDDVEMLNWGPEENSSDVLIKVAPAGFKYDDGRAI